MELKQLVQDIVQDGFTIPLVDISHLCTHSEDATDGSLFVAVYGSCLLYTSPSPRDKRQSRMPSSA